MCVCGWVGGISHLKITYSKDYYYVTSSLTWDQQFKFAYYIVPGLRGSPGPPGTTVMQKSVSLKCAFWTLPPFCRFKATRRQSHPANYHWSLTRLLNFISHHLQKVLQFFLAVCFISPHIIDPDQATCVCRELLTSHQLAMINARLKNCTTFLRKMW